jgi:hypothetical protein
MVVGAARQVAALLHHGEKRSTNHDVATVVRKFKLIRQLQPLTLLSSYRNIIRVSKNDILEVYVNLSASLVCRFSLVRVQDHPLRDQRRDRWTERRIDRRTDSQPRNP